MVAPWQEILKSNAHRDLCVSDKGSETKCNTTVPRTPAQKGDDLEWSSKFPVLKSWDSACNSHAHVRRYDGNDYAVRPIEADVRANPNPDPELVEANSHNTASSR